MHQFTCYWQLLLSTILVPRTRFSGQRCKMVVASRYPIASSQLVQTSKMKGSAEWGRWDALFRWLAAPSAAVRKGWESDILEKINYWFCEYVFFLKKEKWKNENKKSTNYFILANFILIFLLLKRYMYFICHLLHIQVITKQPTHQFIVLSLTWYSNVQVSPYKKLIYLH